MLIDSTVYGAGRRQIVVSFKFQTNHFLSVSMACFMLLETNWMQGIQI